MTYKVRDIKRADNVKDAVKYLGNDYYNEKINLEDNKHKVSEFNRYTYILDTYVIFLCKKAIEMLDDNIPTVKIIDTFKNRDWKTYSYSSKAYYGEYLSKILFESKSTSRTTLLSIQTMYLEEASKILIDVMEDFI